LLGASRPPNKVAATIRADRIHLARASFAEGAFVTANEGFITRLEFGPTFFALGFHFQRHIKSIANVPDLPR
jgi:hypothetical protein